LREDFFLPFGGKLTWDNRWIKLAELIPWDDLEDDYASRFGKVFGAPEVTAKKDDALAPINWPLPRQLIWGRFFGGGGLIETTSGRRKQRVGARTLMPTSISPEMVPFKNRG